MSNKYFEELLRHHEYLKTLSRSDSIQTYAHKEVDDVEDFMALYKQAGFWSFVKDLAHSTAVNLQIFDTVAENIADELEENNYDGARNILLEATDKLIADEELIKKLKAIPNEQITSEVLSKLATDMTNGIVSKLNKSVKAELVGSGMMLDPDGLASLIFDVLGGNEEGAKKAALDNDLIKQADVADMATGAAATIAGLMSWNIGKKVVKATPDAVKKATDLFMQKVKSLGAKATDTALRDSLFKSIQKSLAEHGVPEAARVAKISADKLAAAAVKKPQALNLIKTVLTKAVKLPAGAGTQAAKGAKLAFEKLTKSPKLMGLAKKLGPKWPKIATELAKKLGPRLGGLAAVGGVPFVGQIIAGLGILDLIGNEVSMGEGVPEAEWNRIFDRGAIRKQIFTQLSTAATKMTGKTYEDKGEASAAPAQEKAKEDTKQPETKQPQETHIYKVQKGDSLSGIAAKQLGNKDLWKKIHELNPQIKDPNKIFEGQELKLPGKAQPAKQEAPKAQPAKQEAPKAQPAKQEAPKQEAPKPQPAKQETPEEKAKKSQQVKEEFQQGIETYMAERSMDQYSEEGSKAAASILGKVSRAAALGTLNDYATLLEMINKQEGSNDSSILQSLENEGILDDFGLPVLLRSYTRRKYSPQDIRNLSRIEEAFKNAGMWKAYQDKLLSLRKAVIRKARNAGDA